MISIISFSSYTFETIKNMEENRTRGVSETQWAVLCVCLEWDEEKVT